ncbi:hypothetical protein BDW67DRAFT_188934 [Aspergillus spinulosporus]
MGKSPGLMPKHSATSAASKECSPDDLRDWGPTSELEVSYKLDEPCAVLSPYPKLYLREKLPSAGVSIRLNDEVTEVRRSGKHYCLSTSTRYDALFDKVINATGYVSALPGGLLLNLQFTST